MTAASTTTEKDLLLRVARGEEAAFTELFHQWQSFLATHIFRITESKELTEEIVQDVFLKIWRSREILEKVESFKAYLLVVSKNHAVNTLKKIAKEFQQWEKYAKEAAPEGDDPHQAFYTLIDEAIDQLSERQRQAYILSRHERMTYQQIADHLGIGKESVKTHIELAVKNISSYVNGKLAVAIIFMLLLG